jgi:hypothetical protein
VSRDSDFGVSVDDRPIDHVSAAIPRQFAGVEIDEPHGSALEQRLPDDLIVGHRGVDIWRERLDDREKLGRVGVARLQNR